MKIYQMTEADESISDDIHIDIVENEHISQICYIPVCKEWQKDHCNLLGLPYIHGNMEYQTTHVMVSVDHCRSSTTRIVPAGNCFFRALSFHLLVHRTIIKKYAYWFNLHD